MTGITDGTDDPRPFLPKMKWLLDADPAIRWQVLRDVIDTPEAEVAAERAKIETQGWGARLLELEDADGQWAGGAFIPAGFDAAEWHDVGQPWTATSWVLTQLREFGIDPNSDRLQRAVELIGANARWEHDNEPFWSGEVEECINGRLVADGCYFGVDMSALVDRLVGERLADGGWNCERAEGSTRSSFASTINVLEGLLEFERATGGTAASLEARRTGEEFLLERQLFRRKSTGEPADEDFLRFTYPNRWRYDILRALDHFRSVSLLHDAEPNPRLKPAVDVVRAKWRADLRWVLDRNLPGRTWFDVDDGEGKPSRWITLRAERVLDWWDQWV